MYGVQPTLYVFPGLVCPSEYLVINIGAWVDRL